MGSPKAMLGQKIGRLTVVERAADRMNSYGKPIRMWRCTCDCGGETTTSTSKLKTTRSCGCLVAENLAKATTTHGHTSGSHLGRPRTGEYHSWASMVSRTTNPSHKKWSTWGGRGIDVDPRYLGDGGFDAFLADIGSRPGPGYTLDRRDNDRGYWPDNIRWATAKEQSRNQRTTRMVEWQGRRMSLREAVDLTDLPFSCVHLRIHRRGWSLERALTTPLRGS